MSRLFSPALPFTFCVVAFLALSAEAQQRHGTIRGQVSDSNHGVLQGARIDLEPQHRAVVSDTHGQFTIPDLPAGSYNISITYVGFAPFTSAVGLEPGSVANVNATLQVEAHAEEVTVHAGRERGEVEAINRERTADNILQVLPSEVITSLPNTNVADAIGRLPSVSLERDEGEGKYVQIRGTEPRLTNVTVGGVHLPSPENVRNVKLDVIPSDLVDSIEVSKTLSANQDADAIGGSVNLVPKSAGDQPYISLLGMGGYTPISGGRGNDQFAATAGDRFGSKKQFGILFGGSYDYNSRAIHDIEPGPAANLLPNGNTFFGPNAIDLRNYAYDRSRFGFGGTLDYKISDMSSVYLRGLFSRFRDFGEDWIYSPGIDNFITDPATDPNNTPACNLPKTSGPEGCGSVGFSDVFRRPEQKIWNLQAGARHVFGGMLLNYELALSQANFGGGFARARFGGPGDIPFAIDTSHPFTPQFNALNGRSYFDPTQYTLSSFQLPDEKTFERDVVGNILLNKQYRLGSHYGNWEVGFKGWDARKDQIFADRTFDASGQPMTDYLGTFRVNDFYFNRYKVGPTINFSKVIADFQNNSGNFSNSTDPTGYDAVNNIPANFDTNERIWAGYAMNTLTFGRVRLQTGLRVEHTGDHALGNVVTLDSLGNFSSFSPSIVNHDYTNLFPSVQAQVRITENTIFRAGYGMGIARPNFYDFAPHLTFDASASSGSPSVQAGNPLLKPTHGQNFDVAIERYLKPIGIIQVGGFYKYLTDPIYLVNSVRTVVPFVGELQQQPINGPHAHVAGIELTWQQQLRFLPGALNGMGVRANYSYTTSSASFPAGFGRTDSPALNRQAPNNWNLDITYDKKGISARMGLTHNDAYLWSYAFQDGALGGKRGPLGDTYLYPHTQVDAQVSYWIPRGRGLQAIVSMLNLNNEVFGFYNGSEQFPIQREYYSRTVSAGLRWTLSHER